MPGENNNKRLFEIYLNVTILPFNSDIHKHFAISFRVPSYDFDLEGEDTIMVQVHLRRPSDGCSSEPVTFYYTTKTVTDLKFDGSIQSEDDINYKTQLNKTSDNQLIHSIHHDDYFGEFTTDDGSGGQSFEDNSFDYLSTQQEQQFDVNMPLKCEFDDYTNSLPVDCTTEPLNYASNFNNIPQYTSQTIQNNSQSNTSEYWTNMEHQFQAHPHQGIPVILDISQNVVRSENDSRTAITFH